ncbi:DNA polymerase elongation subunit family B [Halorubrum virus HRTV-26]|nr:DNA polymerase elongation subunit family B [Halorubrum virus HRTV-26]
MKEIYITNTELVYEDYTPKVKLFGRTEAGKSDSVTVENFPAYFYVPADERGKVDPFDNDYLEGYADTDKTGLVDGDELVKVIVNNPKKMGEVASFFSKSWEADVDYTDRLRIDLGIKTGVRVPSSRVTPDEIEPVEMDAPPRVLTFDIETDDRGEGFPDYGQARILSIVAHDNYTDEYVGFIDLDGHGLGDRFPDTNLDEVSHPEDLGLEHLSQLNFEPDERKMLTAFAKYVQEIDADLVVGWNSNGFDTPFVIERMKERGVNADRLSRTGNAYTGYGGPTIQGRTCYDLMDAWKDTKFTKVSGALDNAAQMELEDAKIEHTDKGFYELYSENTRKFLNYNTKDVFLTVGINEAANVLAFKKALRDTIGLDFEQTTANNEFIEMMIRRKLHTEGYAGPTATEPEDTGSYDGAFVFDAFNGLKENVVGIDLASLYPNTLWMLNASPETKVDPLYVEEHDDGLYAVLEEGGDLVPVAKAANDVYFRLDYDGVFRELVDEALRLKEHAGEMKKDDSLSAEEKSKWAEEYSVRKTIVNSIYGVLGWVRFFLYDADIAAAVTLTGQAVIKRTAKYVDEESIANVAYGDTDSNYIEFDSSMNQRECLEAADAITDTLNNEVYVDLAAEYGMPTDPCRFDIEIEMYASHFFMSGQKKFYAYVKVWDEGMDYDAQIKDGKGKLSISGYPCKKANTAQLTKEVQRETLETIVRGGSADEIRRIIREGAERIDASNPDFDLIGIPGGLGKELEDYSWSDGTPKGASPRAAFYANKFIKDCNFGKGNTVKRVYLKHTTLGEDTLDVIGYERGAQLDDLRDQLTVDVKRMQDTLVRNPMVDILDAVDIDVDAAIEGQSQTGLAAFC